MILILLSDKKIDELQFKIFIFSYFNDYCYFSTLFLIQKYLYNIKLSHVVNVADMIVSAYS